MSTTRFEGLRLPHGFTYLDHPFIDHDNSEYVITLDEGTDDPNHPPGWKVMLRNRDIIYAQQLDHCLTFVQMVTNDNPKLSFEYEQTKPRSAVWYGRC